MEKVFYSKNYLGAKVKLGLLLLVYLILFPANAIINGANQTDDFPSVQLVFKNGSHICSGTFIDKYTILTAAHCLTTPKKEWKGFSLELEHIYDRLGKTITLTHLESISHPKYEQHFFKSIHDVGVIKIRKNEYFNKFPKIGGGKGDDSVILYGCGRVNLTDKTRRCLRRTNNIFEFLGHLIMWGKSRNNKNVGHDVSVAPNDSGGALVNKETGRIIGTHWGTWVSLTSRLSLPNLSFSTSLLNKENLSFVQKNLGEFRLESTRE